VLRRRTSRLGSHRRGTGPSQLRSPLTAGQLRRRGRRWLGLLLTLAFALTLGACAAAVVAMATGTSPKHAARKRASRAVAHPPGPRRSHGISSPDPAAAFRAVDRALAYTPFVSAGVPRRRVIALTFDDGPSPYTPEIVRVLVRMHAPATFFVVGQQLDYFAAGLRDEIRHGFVIGDHTENHAWLIRLSGSAQFAQIHQAAVRIRSLGASFPRLFRPPYGSYDARTLAILRELHMLMVLWSVDPRDWLRPGARVIAERVLSAARPGTIVEMHDGGGDRSQTAAALPAIINGLRRRHYQLVTVPELVRIDPPPRRQHLPQLSE